MTTYKGIQGATVQKLAADLTAGSGTVGQLWYNGTGSPTSDGAFKIIQEAGGAWTSAPTMNTARAGFMSAGTQTTALMGGGNGPTTASEQYSGSAWVEGSVMNNGHPQTSGGGAQTAGWCQSGPAVTEFYNGTGWTNQPSSSNTNKAQRAGCGPQTSALLACSEPRTSNAEVYDGSTWTAITAYPLTLRYPEAAGGSNTAALVFCGDNGGSTNASNSWNGSSWSSSPATNTPRFEFGSSGTSSTACMAIAGTTGSTGTDRISSVEEFDGSSWTEQSDVQAVSSQGSGTGTVTATMYAFGNYGPYVGTTPGVTEEWDSPTYAKKTVTMS